MNRSHWEDVPVEAEVDRLLPMFNAGVLQPKRNCVLHEFVEETNGALQRVQGNESTILSRSGVRRKFSWGVSFSGIWW